MKIVKVTIHTENPVQYHISRRGRRGRDRMVDGFMTTSAIRCNHLRCEF